MNKFKVGDRVNVYGPAGSYIAHVTKVKDDFVKVFSEMNKTESFAHYKQCEKVKKTKTKKRKVKKRVTLWGNVQPTPWGPTSCRVYQSKLAADMDLSSRRRIACVKLTGTYEVEE